MRFKEKYHHILFGVTLVLSMVCGYLMTQVNVNSDMTKYLPDSSAMKKGLEIVSDEFGAAEMSTASVKAMFSGLPEERRQAVSDSLAAFPDVEGVDFKTSDDGWYTLYELNVPASVDQKNMGQTIRRTFGKDVVVETSQDSATPPMSTMIVAAVLIILVLVLMAQSWLDPIIFLLTVGLAVVLNIGTNALLPSVSITTNYIGAILQMVLSLDYSIVLMNRYRQEKTDSNTPCEAANIAIRRATPSIMSSALTTVVGLLMLAFMRLKIGADMGLVLAKGVVCSLFCTYTVMPSLMMLFHKGVMNTGKKTFVLPTNRISRYATRFRTPLAILSLAMFITTAWYSRRTDISFSLDQESEISKIFPQKNALVVVYDTKDESKVFPLADSISHMDGVESVISYPSLLQQQYTAGEMADQLKSMMSEYGSALPEGLDAGMLSEDLVRMLYSLKGADYSDLKISFPALADFLVNDVENNPAFASIMDEGMKEKFSMLEAVTGMKADGGEMEEAPAAEPVAEESVPSVVVPSESPVETQAVQEQTVSSADAQDGVINVRSFMPKLYVADRTDETKALYGLSNVEKNNEKMTAAQMSAYIGSTPAQTKMAYSLHKGSTMTPMEYVHFLYDDLFNRKALKSMVSSEQKEGLRVRIKLMDYVQTDKNMSAAEMTAFLNEFGVSGMTEDRVKEIAWPSAAVAENTVAETPVADTTAVVAVKDTLPAVDTALAVAKTAKPRKSKAEAQAELLDDMMFSGRTYTASRMAGNIRRLGESMDDSTMSLLYTYYGSVHDYDDSLTMSMEELVDFIGDEAVNDPRLATFMDDSTMAAFNGIKGQLMDGVSRMRKDDHSLMAVVTTLPSESDRTYAFVDRLNADCAETFGSDGYYVVGESEMFSEMKNGFSREIRVVTILTVLAIFLIVAISFKSIIVPAILVMTVMTAVYVNVVYSGLFSGHMLYLAYLIVQSILMGATIDYGILFTNYYKEYRKTMEINDAVREAYHGSIRTIMTSGLIMVLGPGAMAIFVNDVAIKSIVGSLAIGAAVAIILILCVLPGMLAACDRLVVRKKDRKKDN